MVSGCCFFGCFGVLDLPPSPCPLSSTGRGFQKKRMESYGRDACATGMNEELICLNDE